MSLARAALAGLLAAALTPGCEPPARNRLPDVVNVLVRLDTGGYASLLVDLHAPRRRPGVRVAMGLISWNGQDLAEVVPVQHLGPEGTRRTDLQVLDLLGEGEVHVQVAPPGHPEAHLEVVLLKERSVVVRAFGPGWERWVEVDTTTGAVAEVEPVPSTARFERYGPDRGFAVYLEDGRLMLSLPHQGDDAAIPLLDEVEGVVAVRWVSTPRLGSGADPALDYRFKMAGTLAARAQQVAVDGDLGEWKGDTALAVGELAQLLAGEAYWQGSRDASFAVATRLTPEALCAAVRIRDDQVLPGEDFVVLHVGEREYREILPEGPERRSSEGLDVAFTDRVEFGTGLEACVDGSRWKPQEGVVPFRVLFHDHDPGEGVTIMATAPELPWPALAGVRLPRRGQEGVPPPRGTPVRP